MIMPPNQIKPPATVLIELSSEMKSKEWRKEGRCKATWKRKLKLPWRKAGSFDHHDDIVDSDQWVVNEELSLSPAERGGGRAGYEKSRLR